MSQIDLFVCILYRGKIRFLSYKKIFLIFLRIGVNYKVTQNRYCARLFRFEQNYSTMFSTLERMGNL